MRVHHAPPAQAAPRLPLSEQPTLRSTPLSSDAFETGADDLSRALSSSGTTLCVAIGHAEGTRTVNGGRTAAYYHHGDPANGRRNLGTFSFQQYQDQSVKTPEDADRVQLGRLRARIPMFEAACRRAGVDARDERLQAAFFDLSNQCSPRIWNRFLARLPQTLGGKPLTVKALTLARFDAMFDDKGHFTAMGLKSPTRALADQTRRMNAIEAVISRKTV
jgi:hypothetical protein